MSGTAEGRVSTVFGTEAPAAEFLELPRPRQRAVFFQLPEAVRERLLANLEHEAVLGFLRYLDPDEVADVLALVNDAEREGLLDQLADERREKVAYLLDFDPDTAAGLMHLDYITVSVDRTLDDVARRVRRHESRTGHFPTIFLTEEDEIIGELPGQVLAMTDADKPLREYANRAVGVRFDTDEMELVELFRANPDLSVGVLDADGSILGVIEGTDLLRVVDEAAGETLYDFTGVQHEESVLDGPLAKVKSRYKWLIINLGTAFLAAGAVGLFEDTIAAFTLLAVYMPVVAGMGGNAGTQSMAVTVRGLAYGHISLGTGTRAVINEVLAGAANGFITGALVAVIAAVFNQSPLLGAVLGVSMVLNLIIAGFFGTVIPLVLDRIGKDPATSATIFITTATDVLGFFIFLGLAQIVL